MRNWSDSIDPATIPTDVVLAEAGRRRNTMRKTVTGGRKGGRPPILRPCQWCGQEFGVKAMWAHEWACLDARQRSEK